VYSPSGNAGSAAGAGQYALSELRAWSVQSFLDCVLQGVQRPRGARLLLSPAPSNPDLYSPTTPSIPPPCQREHLGRHSALISPICGGTLQEESPDWPLAATKWSEVKPDEPIIGVEASRCPSE
jgi:hypothetical protein